MLEGKPKQSNGIDFNRRSERIFGGGQNKVIFGKQTDNPTIEELNKQAEGLREDLRHPELSFEQSLIVLAKLKIINNEIKKL